MTISRAEFELRTKRLREKMKANGLDALVVFADEYRPGHATYLTGYRPINLIEESPQLVFLVGDEPPVVLIGRLNSYAAKDIIWMDDVRPIHRDEEYIPEIVRSIADKPARVDCSAGAKPNRIVVRSETAAAKSNTCVSIPTRVN